VISPPEARFDFAVAMCQKSNVKHTSIIVRMLLIVGLVVSPLAPPVFAVSDQSTAMSATDMSSDEMSRADADGALSPCHDGKMDCDKACPCLVACMSLSVQGLPSIASIVARAVVAGQRLAIHSEAQLASLAAPPPARPPRA
jgi:hypothetical protein